MLKQTTVSKLQGNGQISIYGNAKIFLENSGDSSHTNFGVLDRITGAILVQYSANNDSGYIRRTYGTPYDRLDMECRKFIREYLVQAVNQPTPQPKSMPTPQPTQTGRAVVVIPMSKLANLIGAKTNSGIITEVSFSLHPHGRYEVFVEIDQDFKPLKDILGDYEIVLDA